MASLQIKSKHSFINEILSKGHRAAQYKVAAALTRLEDLLKTSLQASPPMLDQAMLLKDAFEKAKDIVLVVLQFGEEHPMFCEFVAIGILVILAPLVIEALGFAELGPIAGTLASLWQSRYAGFVPAESLLSFFQQLGMAWKRNLLLVQSKL